MSANTVKLAQSEASSVTTLPVIVQAAGEMGGKSIQPLQMAGKNSDHLPVPGNKAQTAGARALQCLKDELLDNQDISFKWDAWNDLGQHFSNWGKGIAHSVELGAKTWNIDDIENFLVNTLSSLDNDVDAFVSKYTCRLLGGFIGMGALMLGAVGGLIYYLTKLLVVQPVWTLTKILVRSLVYFLFMIVGLLGYVCIKLSQDYFNEKQHSKELEKQDLLNRPAMEIYNKQIKEGNKLIESGTSDLVRVIKDKNLPEKKRNKAYRTLAEATIYQAKVKAKACALKAAGASTVDVNKVFSEEEQNRKYFYSQLQTVHISIRSDIRHQMGLEADAIIATLEQHLLEATADEFFENIDLYTNKEARDAGLKKLEAVFTHPLNVQKPVKEVLKKKLQFFCQEKMKGCNNVITLLNQHIDGIEGFKDGLYDPELYQNSVKQKKEDLNTLWGVYQKSVACLETLVVLSQEMGMDINEELHQPVDEILQQHKYRLLATLQANYKIGQCIAENQNVDLATLLAKMTPHFTKRASLAIQEAIASGNYYKHLRYGFAGMQADLAKALAVIPLDAEKISSAKQVFLSTYYGAITEEFLKNPSDIALEAILSLSDAESGLLVLKLHQGVQALIQQKKKEILALDNEVESVLNVELLAKEISDLQAEKERLTGKKDQESQVQLGNVTRKLEEQTKALQAHDQRLKRLKEKESHLALLPMLERMEINLRSQAVSEITSVFDEDLS